MKNMMKHVACLLLVLCGAWACSEESDVRPGLYTEQDIIETFPGDTVLLQGQVSNYVGMKSVTISCETWGIVKVYDLYGEQSKVFDYNYRMPVPEDAEFDAELKITAVDINGREQKKTITLTYLPDTEAPVDNSGQPWQMSYDYDTSVGSAAVPVRIAVSDDRSLSQAVINIESLGYTNTIELSGRTTVITDNLTIDNVGNFDMSVEVTDDAGNSVTIWHQLVVMLAEDEDPIDNYPRMWVVNASENADDYLAGYYAPMSRADGDYQYSGKIYADKDGYEFYIVPEQTMDGDVFGASPYVNSKLMNKAGYVVPVKIETAGYYGLWIDIQNHQWSVWSLDVSAAYSGSLTLSGCGFSDFGDWGTPGTEMTRDGYRYTQTVGQNGSYSGTRQYYAARVSDWGYILRWWGDAAADCGWWEDTAGYGGSVGSYESDYDGNVEVMFDTAILWATVKKQ